MSSSDVLSLLSMVCLFSRGESAFPSDPSDGKSLLWYVAFHRRDHVFPLEWSERALLKSPDPPPHERRPDKEPMGSVRIETAPGEPGQVDWGYFGFITHHEHTYRLYAFVMTLG